MDRALENGRGPNGGNDLQLTRRQKVLIGTIVCGIFLLWIVSLQSPIPSGKKNREKAGVFLKELFPDRAVSPDDSTAPVAVVFHLIRSGEPDVARRAIEFADDPQFGYAAPYVIERLGSDDPELEEAAQRFLCDIAGDDYGPDAESWKAWWRDPPRKLFGFVPVLEHTFAIAVPAVSASVGVLLLVIAKVWRRDVVAPLGWALLASSWFMSICLAGIRLVGHSETCTFGPSCITYHSSHGAVIGLEDARVGGMGLWAGLMAVYVLVPFLLVIVYVVIAGAPRITKPPSDPAGAA